MKNVLFPILLVVFSLGAGLAGDEKTKSEKDKVPTEQNTKAGKKEDPKTATVTAGGGMVATISGNGFATNTGLSPEIREALNQMVNTSSEGLKEKVLEDGTVIVDLEGRFRSAMVVTIGKDGKASGVCYGHAPTEKCAHDKTEPAKPVAKPKKND